jgi:hypothetical protein
LAWIVTFALAVTEAFFAEVAVMTTGPVVAGAVYVVATPLAVLAGANDPQEPTGVQLQLTPSAVPVTVATICAVAFGARVAGGAVDMVTVTREELPQPEM